MIGLYRRSLLGPLLFLLYLFVLQHILSTLKDISYHAYADDIQLYIYFKPQDISVAHHAYANRFY